MRRDAREDDRGRGARATGDARPATRWGRDRDRSARALTRTRRRRRARRSSEEDEDPVDHKVACEERCMPKCEKFVRAYEACAERIEGDETGEAHCTGQYFDMYKCVDECAKKEVMARTR